MDSYEEQGLTFDKAVHLAANDDLPYLRKRLRQDYAQFLIDFYELQEDPIQQKILESARALGNQHDMKHTDSIRQAVKLRKNLFMDLWLDHHHHRFHSRLSKCEDLSLSAENKRYFVILKRIT